MIGVAPATIKPIIADIMPPQQAPVSTGRPRLVVLGSGWAGARLTRDIDCKSAYDLTVISPRNHMVFTPLLAATTVGTINVQSVIEHLRHLQPNLSLPQNNMLLADALAVDAEGKTVRCRGVDGTDFDVRGCHGPVASLPPPLT